MRIFCLALGLALSIFTYGDVAENNDKEKRGKGNSSEYRQYFNRENPAPHHISLWVLLLELNYAESTGLANDHTFALEVVQRSMRFEGSAGERKRKASEFVTYLSDMYEEMSEEAEAIKTRVLCSKEAYGMSLKDIYRTFELSVDVEQSIWQKYLHIIDSDLSERDSVHFKKLLDRKAEGLTYSNHKASALWGKSGKDPRKTLAEICRDIEGD